MKFKKFIIKGASILVLQEGEMVEFYMNYKTSDYFFCVGYKAKIEDITECDAINIRNQYFDILVGEEDILISLSEAAMKAMMKQKKRIRCSLPGQHGQQP